MDILRYAAVKEQTDMCICVVTANTVICNCLTNASSCFTCSSYCMAQANCYISCCVPPTYTTANNLTTTCLQVLGGSFHSPCCSASRWCLQRNPCLGCCGVWASYIPCAPSNATVTGFKVCAGSGGCPGTSAGVFCQCGACFLWTVPAGATYARFQIWGAGAPSGSGCCCGGGLGGPSGAYASVIIKVTPGCQYTMCAGCAYCCGVLWSNAAYPGCCSYVVGEGLCGFCADGGHPYAWGNWAYCLNKQNCTYATHSSTYCCSAGTSNYNNFCNCGLDMCPYGAINCGTTQWSCYMPGFLFSNCTRAYGNAAGASANSVVYTIPGMMPCFCAGNGWQCGKLPPIFGYEEVSQCVFGSSSTAGMSCCNAYRTGVAYPGMGGFGGFLSGGCTYQCDTGYSLCGGDMGKAGMVCVQYW